MTFTSDGATITQTAGTTDANLSGLSSIPGVTTLAAGSGSTLFTVYDLGTLNLVIDGTLTITVDDELLITRSVAGSGVLNVEGEKTTGSDTFYSQEVFLKQTVNNGSHFVAPLLNFASLTLNWKGGTMVHQTFIQFNEVNGTGFQGLRATGFAGVQEALFGVNSNTLFDELYHEDCVLANRGGVVGRINKWNPVGNFAALNADASSAFGFSGQLIDLGALNPIGNGLIDCIRGEKSRIIGFAKVPDCRMLGSIDATLTQRASHRTTINVKFNSRDSNDIVVDNFKVLLLTYDDGNVYDSATDATLGLGITALFAGEDFDETNHYVLSGDNTGTVTENILQVFHYSSLSDNSTEIKNYRGKNGGLERDSYWLSYLQQNAIRTYEFKGLGDNGDGLITISEKETPDSLITEQDESIIASLVILDNTATQRYDAIKLYWRDDFISDNLANITENTNILDFLPTRIENTLICLTDVDVDPNATNNINFDVVAQKLILKSATSGNLTLPTDKTVTLLNGAVIDGGIIDSNGDSFLNFDSVDSWEVYSDASRTNLLDSGNSTDNFRFTFVDSTTYYVNLTIGNETIFKEVTPLETGETLVSLSVSGSILALSAQIPSKEEITDAVWNADVSSYTIIDSTGEALSNSGGSSITASDIWEYDISSITTEGQAGKELLDASATDEATEIEIHAALDSYINKDAFKADVSNLLTNNDARLDNLDVATSTLSTLSITDINDALNNYDSPTKAELDIVETNLTNTINNNSLTEPIEANIKQVNNIAISSVDDFKASFDDTNIITEINNNELKIDEIKLAVDNLPTNAPLTVNEFHAALDSYNNKNDYKADVSLLALETTVNSLNNLSTVDIINSVPSSSDISNEVWNTDLTSPQVNNSAGDQLKKAKQNAQNAFVVSV